MLKRLEKLEKELMDVYAEIQNEIPNLRSISFEIIEGALYPKPVLYGYYHIGDNYCKAYRSVSELAALIAEAREKRAKNEILYQQFGGIL